MRLPHAVTLTLVAGVLSGVGCAERPDAVATGDSADTAALDRGCPANKQSFTFIGSLDGKREAVQRALGRGAGSLLWKRGDKAVENTTGQRRYTLYPTCKSHQFTDGELVDGRFVALLRIDNDPDRRFSKVADNDVVAWWVYGIRQADGSIELVSQFASLAATTEQDFVVTLPFVRCNKTGYWDEEEAGWHGSECESEDSAMVRPPGGDNPWFGCTRGCCYSVGPSDPAIPKDSLPADTLPRDTTRRDTTRTPGRA